VNRLKFNSPRRGPDVTVVLEAMHDFQIVASKLVRVRHGHAQVVFEGNEKFQNDVSILAYAFGVKPGDNLSQLNAGGCTHRPVSEGPRLKVDVS